MKPTAYILILIGMVLVATAALLFLTPNPYASAGTDGPGEFLSPSTLRVTLLVAAGVVMAVESLEKRDWILRLIALGAVVELTSAYLGMAMLLAFAVLSSLRTPRPGVANARLEPAVALPPAS